MNPENLIAAEKLVFVPSMASEPSSVTEID
jgi:hypothetical protein